MPGRSSACTRPSAIGCSTSKGDRRGHGRIGAAPPRDRITVLTGPSGVGKSSLLNALYPALNLETGDLRDFMNKGKHTTRTATLLPLPYGEQTFVADTPGIRELGLYEIDPADLAFYLWKWRRSSTSAAIPTAPTTTNRSAPCAAVDVGTISPQRYDSYLRCCAAKTNEARMTLIHDLNPQQAAAVQGSARFSWCWPDPARARRASSPSASPT
ncbi:MAG: GTPase RsgA [Caldilineaceae bacterium]